MKKRVIVVIVLIVALIGAGGIIAYYSYQNSHYVSTEDAQISANLVTVTPEITGKITEWNIKEGDEVKADQPIGRQDINSVITSSAISSQALTTSADSIVSKAEIRSPISGRVIQSSAVEGQVAAPGSSLAVIADTSDLYVNANIKETSITRIKPGQAVEISIDAYPGKRFTGYVESVGQAAKSVFSILPTQNASGNFTKVTQLMPVKISIEKTPGITLMPGMNVTVKIHIG